MAAITTQVTPSRSKFGAFLLICVVGFFGCQKDSSNPTTTGTMPSQEDADDVLFLILEEGNWGFMNQDGHLAIGPYFDAAWPFSDGRALVEVDGLYGYIDREGDTVIQPQFLDAWYFSNGLAPVQTASGWAYIDTSGAVVVETDHPGTYVGAAQSIEKLDIDRVRVGDLYGFRNADGQIVIDPQFDQAWHFSEGLARVSIDGKWGFIDRSGKQVIAPTFDVAWDFENGLARIQIDSKFGYVNKTGEYVWAPTN